MASLFAQTTAPVTKPAFEIVGQLDPPRLRESSGIVASQKYPGVFWTHNDSGNAPSLFAITREGKLISEIPVQATNIDWEDIAIDSQNNLYLADIGNNSKTRKQVQIYCFPEPDPKVPTHVQPSATWKLTYPDQPFDAESLFIVGGNGYVISKNLEGNPAGIYRFALEPSTGPIKLESVCELPVQAPVTGADVSPDQKQLAIITITGPVLFDINSNLTQLHRRWEAVFLDPAAEAICFTTGGLLATTEGRRVIFFALPPTRE